MDGNHPKNKDLRPKRAKDKDNPYTIFTVGLNTEHPRYYLEFTDLKTLNGSLTLTSVFLMKVEPSCAGNRIAIKKIFAYRQTEHPGEVPGALFLFFDQHSQMAN